MARKPQSDLPARMPSPQSVFGRALVDIPSAGLACGEYAEIAAEIAAHFVAAGAFDEKAAKPAKPGVDHADE